MVSLLFYLLLSLFIHATLHISSSFPLPFLHVLTCPSFCLTSIRTTPLFRFDLLQQVEAPFHPSPDHPLVPVVR